MPERLTADGAINRVPRTKRASPAPYWAPWLTHGFRRPEFYSPKKGMLKKWRLECGFTQVEAAYRLGMGASNYKLAEHGKVPITQRTWLACRALWLQCDVGQAWLTEKCDGKVKLAKIVLAYFEATDFRVKPKTPKQEPGPDAKP